MKASGLAKRPDHPQPVEGKEHRYADTFSVLEQALSAGIAHRGRDVPQYHHGKAERFFALYDQDHLEQKSLKWLSERETGRT